MDHPDPDVAQQAFLRFKAASVLGNDVINHFAENFSMPEGGNKGFREVFGTTSGFNDEVVAGLTNARSEDPTLKLSRIVDELYSNTKFSTIHRLAKYDWENDSTYGAFSWMLQESVGRQFDGDVEFFSGNRLDTMGFDADEGGYERGFRIMSDMSSKELDRNWNEEDLGAKPTQEDIDEYVRVHKDLSRWMLDLAFPDTDTVTVYRGTTSEEVEKVLTSADGESLLGEEVELQANPLTSWTLKPDVAFKFSARSSGSDWLLEPISYEPYTDEMNPKAEPVSNYDAWVKYKADDVVILTSEIPKDEIFSHFGSYAFKGNENEIIVIDSPTRKTQIWDYRDSAEQMADDSTPPIPQTIKEEMEKLPENLNEYSWKDWAKEWGREEASVHPRLWKVLDDDEKLEIDEYADVDESVEIWDGEKSSLSSKKVDYISPSAQGMQDKDVPPSSVTGKVGKGTPA